LVRIAILADIHANLPALEAVTRDLQTAAPDMVVVAGDLVNLGPFPREVIEFVLAAKWPLIRGNHEWYILDSGTNREKPHWHNYHPIAWTKAAIGADLQQQMAAWPDTLCLNIANEPHIRILHGSMRDHSEGLFPNATDEQAQVWVRGIAEPLAITAHTHLPLDRTIGHVRVCNPGSVGWPFDGMPVARYLLLESSPHGWQPTFRTVAYDREPITRAFAQHHYAEQCGVIGQLVIEEFVTQRPRIFPFSRWRERHATDVTIFDQALLDRWRHEDPWQYISPAYHINR
jgi:predicted phosphodiesterase